jgi:hypothetical protein
MENFSLSNLTQIANVKRGFDVLRTQLESMEYGEPDKSGDDQVLFPLTLL